MCTTMQVVYEFSQMSLPGRTAQCLLQLTNQGMFVSAFVCTAMQCVEEIW